MGNDTFNVQYSKSLATGTMVIGIDVCHATRKSIAGFVSSYNQEMTKYVSQLIE
jgi:hypothetical protein